MNQDLIKDINRNIRVYIKMRRNRALKSLSGAIIKKNLDGIKVLIMDSAHLVRIDLELLFRVVFSANLSEAELSERILLEQKDMLKKDTKRLNLDTNLVDTFSTEFKNKESNLSCQRIDQIEKNTDILGKIFWHKSNLNGLYNTFYARLSKCSHPDPFIIFLPDECFKIIKDEIFPTLSLCAQEIDKEWDNLENASVQPKNVN